MSNSSVVWLSLVFLLLLASWIFYIIKDLGGNEVSEDEELYIIYVIGFAVEIILKIIATLFFFAIAIIGIGLAFGALNDWINSFPPFIK